MTSKQIALLENVMDSLDRLFDRETKVIDIYALLFATEHALQGSNYAVQIKPILVILNELACKNYSEEERREEALTATNSLRHFLAETLPFP